MAQDSEAFYAVFAWYCRTPSGTLPGVLKSQFLQLCYDARIIRQSDVVGTQAAAIAHTRHATRQAPHHEPMLDLEAMLAAAQELEAPASSKGDTAGLGSSRIGGASSPQHAGASSGEALGLVAALGAAILSGQHPPLHSTVTPQHVFNLHTLGRPSTRSGGARPQSQGRFQFSSSGAHPGSPQATPGAPGSGLQGTSPPPGSGPGPGGPRVRQSSESPRPLGGRSSLQPQPPGQGLALEPSLKALSGGPSGGRVGSGALGHTSSSFEVVDAQGQGAGPEAGDGWGSPISEQAQGNQGHGHQGSSLPALGPAADAHPHSGAAGGQGQLRSSIPQSNGIRTYTPTSPTRISPYLQGMPRAATANGIGSGARAGRHARENGFQQTGGLGQGPLMSQPDVRTAWAGHGVDGLTALFEGNALAEPEDAAAQPPPFALRILDRLARLEELAAAQASELAGLQQQQPQPQVRSSSGTPSAAAGQGAAGVPRALAGRLESIEARLGAVESQQPQAQGQHHAQGADPALGVEALRRALAGSEQQHAARCAELEARITALQEEQARMAAQFAQQLATVKAEAVGEVSGRLQAAEAASAAAAAKARSAAAAAAALQARMREVAAAASAGGDTAAAAGEGDGQAADEAQAEAAALELEQVSERVEVLSQRLAATEAAAHEAQAHAARLGTELAHLRAHHHTSSASSAAPAAGLGSVPHAAGPRSEASTVLDENAQALSELVDTVGAVGQAVEELRAGAKALGERLARQEAAEGALREEVAAAAAAAATASAAAAAAAADAAAVQQRLPAEGSELLASFGAASVPGLVLGSTLGGTARMGMATLEAQLPGPVDEAVVSELTARLAAAEDVLAASLPRLEQRVEVLEVLKQAAAAAQQQHKDTATAAAAGALQEEDKSGAVASATAASPPGRAISREMSTTRLAVVSTLQEVYDALVQLDTQLQGVEGRLAALEGTGPGTGARPSMAGLETLPEDRAVGGGGAAPTGQGQDGSAAAALQQVHDQVAKLVGDMAAQARSALAASSGVEALAARVAALETAQHQPGQQGQQQQQHPPPAEAGPSAEALKAELAAQVSEVAQHSLAVEEAAAARIGELAAAVAALVDDVTALRQGQHGLAAQLGTAASAAGAAPEAAAAASPAAAAGATRRAVELKGRLAALEGALPAVWLALDALTARVEVAASAALAGGLGSVGVGLHGSPERPHRQSSDLAALPPMPPASPSVSLAVGGTPAGASRVSAGHMGGRSAAMHSTQGTSGEGGASASAAQLDAVYERLAALEASAPDMVGMTQRLEEIEVMLRLSNVDHPSASASSPTGAAASAASQQQAAAAQAAAAQAQQAAEAAAAAQRQLAAQVAALGAQQGELAAMVRAMRTGSATSIPGAAGSDSPVAGAPSMPPPALKSSLRLSQQHRERGAAGAGGPQPGARFPRRILKRLLGRLNCLEGASTAAFIALDVLTAQLSMLRGTSSGAAGGAAGGMADAGGKLAARVEALEAAVAAAAAVMAAEEARLAGGELAGGSTGGGPGGGGPSLAGGLEHVLGVVGSRLGLLEGREQSMLAAVHQMLEDLSAAETAGPEANATVIVGRTASRALRFMHSNANSIASTVAGVPGRSTSHPGFAFADSRTHSVRWQLEGQDGDEGGGGGDGSPDNLVPRSGSKTEPSRFSGQGRVSAVQFAVPEDGSGERGGGSKSGSGGQSRLTAQAMAAAVAAGAKGSNGGAGADGGDDDNPASHWELRAALAASSAVMASMGGDSMNLSMSMAGLLDAPSRANSVRITMGGALGDESTPGTPLRGTHGGGGGGGGGMSRPDSPRSEGGGGRGSAQGPDGVGGSASKDDSGGKDGASKDGAGGKGAGGSAKDVKDYHRQLYEMQKVMVEVARRHNKLGDRVNKLEKSTKNRLDIQEKLFIKLARQVDELMTPLGGAVPVSVPRPTTEA